MSNSQEKIQFQIGTLYREILEREPDKEGLEYWSNKMLNDNMTLQAVKQEFYNSPEYRQIDPVYNFSNEKNPPRGFFDDYPQFFKTSQLVEHPNNLNGRYKAIIESNKDIIKKSKILDIASHDGRWSFAALKNDASYVFGVEGRKHLVENAIKNMITYDIPKEMFSFIQGNIEKEITKINPNQFDVVFCLGFLYHTLNNWNLLYEIKRINPKYLILDTRVNSSPENLIKLEIDNAKKEAFAISDSLLSKNDVLVGIPSKPALEMMLKNLDFDFEYFNWRENILNFRNLVGYYLGRRVTLVAKNKFYKK